jgi:hypothetical protein
LVTTRWREQQQDQPNGTDDYNVGKVTVNSAIPGLYSFDGHDSSVRQIPPGRKDNQ